MKVSIHTFSLSIFVIAATALMSPISTHAQLAEKQHTCIWVNGGVGLSSLGSVGLSANLSVQYGEILFSMRTTRNIESLDAFTRSVVLNDLGLLIGFASKKSELHSSISIGVALVTGYQFEPLNPFPLVFDDGNVEGHDISSKIGIPIEAQFFLRSSSYIGFGVYMYANINAVQSFAGITLSLQLGKLR